MNQSMKGVYRSMWWVYGGQSIPTSRMARTKTSEANSMKPTAKMEYPKRFPMRNPFSENEDITP